MGINPLALVAYEAVHKGYSPRLGGLLSLAAGLLCIRQLTTLGDAVVHPTVWLLTDALLTAWWIVGAYKRGERGAMANVPGLIAAAAVGGVLWLARNYVFYKVFL